MKDNSHLWYIVLGLIVVVSAVGTLAFLYYTTSKNSIAYEPLNTTSTPLPRATTAPTTVPTPTIDPSIADLKTTSNSDTIEDIQSDLEKTNLNNIDKELVDIEGELQ